MSDIAHALREPWVRLDEQLEAGRFGMWIFLASELLFFGAFFFVYAYLRTLHPDAFRLASSQTGLAYGTANTIILVTSSFTMALALAAARVELRRITLICLTLTSLLGLAFLVVKGFEYRDDLAKGLWPGRGFTIRLAAAQLFFAAYWFITAIHLLHLTIGIVAVVRLVFAIVRQGLPLVSPQLDLTGLYWSFVDIVWLCLFPAIYLAGRG